VFTGIIDEVGQLADIMPGAGTRRLRIQANRVTQDLDIGDSICVNGVCLTVVEHTDGDFCADLAAETWERTSFSRLAAGAKLNLERPLRVGDRFDGHMVQGHVESVGQLLDLTPVANAEDFWLRIKVTPDLEKYLVYKGSVAIEGISLTVANLENHVLTVAIIPHTCKMTNLSSLTAGDYVNIETDIAAKYLAKWAMPETAEVNCRASNPASCRYAIVVSDFNALITERLLDSSLATLIAGGVPQMQIETVHVPGAYEIPIASQFLAQSGNYDAVICLGCLIRGTTLHYEIIAQETARGIGESALKTGIPHSFGVLACDTQEQAFERAGMKLGNLGTEAAGVAMRMANLKRRFVPENTEPVARNWTEE
jgi:riboflavin synthase